MAVNVKFTPITNISTSAVVINENFRRMAEALSKVLSLQGEGPNSLQAPLDLNHFPLQNVGDPQFNTDAVNFKTLQDYVSNGPLPDKTVVNVEIIDGHLIVSFSDNTTVDLGPIGGTTPPVIPAPVFTTQPSLSPQYIIAGNPITITPGVVTGAVSVVRAAAMGTTALTITNNTITPLVAGTGTYIETATGPDGQVTASLTKTFTVAAANGALRPLPLTGQNLSFTSTGRSGVGYAYTDRAKSADPWYAPGVQPQDMPLDVNMYPTGYPSTTADYNETQMPVEFTYGPPGIDQVYVIESTQKVTVQSDQVQTLMSAVWQPDRQVYRTEFRATSPEGDLARGYWVRIFMRGTLLAPGQNFCNAWRKDEEAEYRAGGAWRQQYVNDIKGYGEIRVMDLIRVNARSQPDFEGYTKRNHFSWNFQTPVEVLVELANAANVDMWFNIAQDATDDHVTKVIQQIMGLLNPNLRLRVELSNEAWNSKYTALTYFFNTRPGEPEIPGGGSVSWGNYGYRAAQVAALARKVSGYSPRVRPCIMGQAVNPSVLEGNIAGAKYAMAEWANPSHANYNPEYTARFNGPIGILFDGGIGVAVYVAAGISEPNKSQADQDECARWVAADQAGDDANGLAKYFQQLRYGNLIASPNGAHVSNMVSLYASLRSLAAAENARMVAYEGCICPEEITGGMTPGLTVLRKKSQLDIRMKQLYIDWITECVHAGFDTILHLSDIGEAGGTYGAREHPYVGTFPRREGLAAIEASPPAANAMYLTIDGSGTSNVGSSPINKINFGGGRGNITLIAADLLPGRSVDVNGNIVGTYQQATTTPVVATISIADEVGNTKSVTFTQSIGAAFSPDTVPGLMEWFTADAGVTSDTNGAVTQWVDQKSGKIAAPPTGVTGPTLMPDGFGTGKPAFKFDMGKYLRTNSPLGEQDFTLVFVFNLSPYTNNAGTLIGGGSKAVNIFTNFGTVRLESEYSQGIATLGGAQLDNMRNILVVTYTASTKTVTMSMNGGAVTTGTNNDTFSTYNYTLGRTPSAGGDQDYAGLMAAVLRYGTVVSNDDQARLLAFLKTRHNTV